MHSVECSVCLHKSMWKNLVKRHPDLVKDGSHTSHEDSFQTRAVLPGIEAWCCMRKTHMQYTYGISLLHNKVADKSAGKIDGACPAGVASVAS